MTSFFMDNFHKMFVFPLVSGCQYRKANHPDVAGGENKRIQGLFLDQSAP
jgi:hypothetical protein